MGTDFRKKRLRGRMSLIWSWPKGSAEWNGVAWRWGSRSGSHRLKKAVTLTGSVAGVRVR